MRLMTALKLNNFKADQKNHNLMIKKEENINCSVLFLIECSNQVKYPYGIKLIMLIQNQQTKR